MEWHDTNWMKRAACADQPPETKVAFHFGEPGYDAQQAKSICAGCPVQMDCLHQAMLYEAENRGHYRFGVWGGMTATERTRLSLEDGRYAIYPEGFTDLEVLTIFEEVIADMRVQFKHNVDGFKSNETVEMADKVGKQYVDAGHGVEVKAVAKKAPAKKAPAKKSVAKKAAPKVVETVEAEVVSEPA